MSTFANVLTALKQVILLQDRVERMEGRLDAMNDDIDGLAGMMRDLDKRLYAIERIMEFSARTSRQAPQLGIEDQ